MAPRLSRRPRAVIFDMDGLMLDTEPLAARAWSVAAEAVGLAFDASVTGRLIGRTFVDCRALILAHHGDGYAVDTLMSAWHDAYDGIVAREGVARKPGLDALLDWLDAQRIPKAVATSTRRSRALAKLAMTGLAPRFGIVVGGDDIARGKPAPDIFEAALARLAVRATDALVLEDSEPGVRGAIAAGIPPIMVPDLHAPGVELAALEVTVMTSLADVRDHLATLPA